MLQGYGQRNFKKKGHVMISGCGNDGMFGTNCIFYRDRSIVMRFSEGRRQELWIFDMFSE